MPSDVSLAERRATLLQAAAKVGHNVTSILDPDELLKKTVDIICDEFGFYYAGVFLIDETDFEAGRRWAVLRAGRGAAGAAMMAEGYKLEVNGRSMIGAATGMGSAIIALDVGEEPVHFKNPHLPDTRSEMALPLMVGDAERDVYIIGALTVQSTEEAAFSDDDITALQAMADQLAIAIHNARLYDQNRQLLEQAERRTRLLKAAAQVGRDVASILDLDELLSTMVDIICDTYGFYYAGVFLVEELDDEPSGSSPSDLSPPKSALASAKPAWAVLRAGRGEAGAAMVAEGHKLEVGGHSMIGAAAGMQGALIALDVGEQPVHFKNPHLPDTRSEMALPLVMGGDLIGALTVQSTEEAAFSGDDITSLQAMADHLAVAIRNAQLLKELEAAHAELLRTKTYEALATATIEAIHWIGNKALPISAGVQRLIEDLDRLPPTDPERLESMREDLEMIADSAALIVSVQEHLIGPAREEQPRPAMVEDVVRDAAVAAVIPAEMISYTVAPDLPLVRADTTQLGRAFGYVLQNAVEAVEGADEKRITVEVAPADDFVVIRIADTGPGIPEEELDKIWAAFYTTKGAQHAGLGLSAALQVLRQIEGRITVANAPDGAPLGGAVFDVLVPVYDGPLPEAALPARKKVLLIDDDDTWSRFATAALKDAGNKVTRSADGRAKLAPFDLILMDAVLEHADSRAVLEQVVAEGAGGKTLVVASGLRVEATMALIQLGARDVVLKPYTAAALAEIVG
jgi:GAF domain-containing protein/CheY-like chemotaxis protein